ncbi:hypothetical protein [Arcticibacterium luteifluviistationis]|uniref:Uncharacterized protein n=1 Tax=Arcticibacterium luteifluviistationis TaxID=1784714 RepID=A0A2Z4GFE1_9BACT|nr:hypothetical protein [Arcticibacterium luteifluviistationis]AWW00100.1 hypothetical protein DJ013_18765 [Arcticibacterium luteifluviistationis]
MHDIEPYHNWQKYYQADKDMRSPFFGREYSIYYENDVYGYYIDPHWDDIGSETLYIKLLYTDYTNNVAVLELFGEWNDTLHNDVMHLKRNVIDRLLKNGIDKFILIAENLFQFHGGDQDYYEEWFDDVEDGWISIINAPEFILSEMQKYRLDYYMNFGGTLQFENWRTLKPQRLFDLVDALMQRRLGA